MEVPDLTVTSEMPTDMNGPDTEKADGNVLLTQSTQDVPSSTQEDDFRIPVKNEEIDLTFMDIDASEPVSLLQEDAAKKEAEEEAAALQKVLESGPSSYAVRTAARLEHLRASFVPPNQPEKPDSTYRISHLYSFPQQSVSTNVLLPSRDCSCLYSSGSDGYIRRYAWYPFIRRRTYNKESLQYVAKGLFENPSVAALENMGVGDISKAKFGPAQVSMSNVQAVHSLVVSREQVFCLAGSAEGVINLFGVRLDEGQCRASLGLRGKGHKRGQPVSALALSRDERQLLSGGWDGQILVCSTDYAAIGVWTL